MQAILNKTPIMLYGEKSDLKKISGLIHTLTEGVQYKHFDINEQTNPPIPQLLFGVQDLYEKKLI